MKRSFRGLKGRADWSTVFISFLDKTSGSLQLNIIKMLAVIGNLKSVEHLYRLGKSTINPLIDHEVNQAIAVIQLRHGKGDKGWLSVEEIDIAEGGLTIVEKSATEGALSVELDKKQKKFLNFLSHIEAGRTSG